MSHFIDQTVHFGSVKGFVKYPKIFWIVLVFSIILVSKPLFAHHNNRVQNFDFFFIHKHYVCSVLDRKPIQRLSHRSTLRIQLNFPLTKQYCEVLSAWPSYIVCIFRFNILIRYKYCIILSVDTQVTSRINCKFNCLRPYYTSFFALSKWSKHNRRVCCMGVKWKQRTTQALEQIPVETPRSRWSRRESSRLDPKNLSNSKKSYCSIEFMSI